MRLKDHAPVFPGEITAVLGLFICFLAVLAARAETGLDLSEKDLEAVFLSKIPPYVTWPTTKQLSDSEDLVLGILGKDPELEALLQGLLKARPADAKPCIVKSVSAAEEVTRCHIVFIPRNENEHWRELLAKDINVSGVLTVGETDNFVRLGYVFNLNFPAKKKLKLEISSKNAKSAGLLIKPELLKLANVIR